MRLLPRSPRGNWLLAATAWVALCGLVWLMLPPQPRAEWPVDAPTFPIGFVPGTRILVAGRVMAAWDGAGGATLGPLRSYDADTGRVTDWLLAEGEAVRLRTIVLSPDGKRAAVARARAGSSSMQLFDPVTALKTADLPLAAGGEVSAVCFSADGQVLAFSEMDAESGCVHVWDIAKAEELPRLRPGGGRIAFAPDGRTLAIADDPGPAAPAPVRVRMWDTASGKLLREWEGPSCGGCQHLQFAPDGQRLVAAFSERDTTTFPNPARIIRGRPIGFWVQVRGWNVANGDEVFQIGCDREVFPRGESWFATAQCYWNPATNIAWSNHGFDGNETSGVKLDGWEWPSPMTIASNDRLLPVVRLSALSPVQGWVDRIGIRWRIPHTKSARARFVDVRTGQEFGGLPPWHYGSFDDNGRDGTNPAWIIISPAEDLSAVEHNGYIRIWDISPGTPWTWFAAIAVALALLLSLFTRWRIRRQALRPHRDQSRLFLVASDPRAV